ncbi:hypothetical protein DL767_003953 [Monosporascus sp. MG133]|nr:hypothetical protein DL767_003953 [Monosporascus sp. MG133]
MTYAAAYPVPQDFYGCDATTAVAMSPTPSHVSETASHGDVKVSDEERARNGRVKGRDPAKQKETAPERTAVDAKEQPTEALLVLYGPESSPRTAFSYHQNENLAEDLLVMYRGGVVTKAYVLLVPSLMSHILRLLGGAPRKELIVERHLVPLNVNAGSLYPGVGRASQNPIDRAYGDGVHRSGRFCRGQRRWLQDKQPDIECKDKAKFTIHLRAANDYAWRHRKYSLNIVIFLDDEHAKGELCREGDTLFHAVGARCWPSHHPGPHRWGSGLLGPRLSTSCLAGDALEFPITNTPYTRRQAKGWAAAAVQEEVEVRSVVRTQIPVHPRPLWRIGANAAGGRRRPRGHPGLPVLQRHQKHRVAGAEDQLTEALLALYGAGVVTKNNWASPTSAPALASWRRWVSREWNWGLLSTITLLSPSANPPAAGSDEDNPQESDEDDAVETEDDVVESFLEKVYTTAEKEKGKGEPAGGASAPLVDFSPPPAAAVTITVPLMSMAVLQPTNLGL